MRIEDIHDQDLRAWAQQYVEEKRGEYRGEKRSIEPVVDVWKTWSEGDWRAWREILPLRKDAYTLFRAAEVQECVQRRIAQSSASYSLGLEVAALRELLSLGSDRKLAYYRDCATPFGTGMLVLGVCHSQGREGFEMRMGSDGFRELHLKPGYAWRRVRSGGYEVARGEARPVPPPELDFGTLPYDREH